MRNLSAMVLIVLVAACGTLQAGQDVSPSADDENLPRSFRDDSRHDQGWLELCQTMVKDSEARAPATQEGIVGGQPSSAPASGAVSAPYTPWWQRYGPAYPGDFRHSFGRDVKELLPTVWDDTKATFTNPWSIAGMLAAGAAGIALASTDADDTVEDHFTRHGSQLNSFWDSVGDVGGNPGTHFAAAGAMYIVTLASGDNRNYEVSKTLINALAINGVVTLTLKGVFRTESPNGDENGWPSGHASSSFCLATVLAEEYGPVVGVPLYGFATFVAYERVDARNHDFSDVVSGALIGMAIGHAVTKNHQMRLAGLEVQPYFNPSNGAVGVALVKNW